MDSAKVAHGRSADGRATATATAHRHRSHQTSASHPAMTQSLELSKVVRLLEDPLTTNLKERHLFVLKKLLKRNQNGFLLRELRAIAKVTDICGEKVAEHPEYLEILDDILGICRLPFLKEKTSDELHYAHDVVHFLSHMGCLMRVSDAGLRLHLVECVRSFFGSVAPRRLLDGLQPTPPGYRLQLLERSDVAQTLLLSLSAVEEQPAIRLQILHTLQLLSSSSDVNCAQMVRARGAETLCLHMNEVEPTGQVLARSAEILCNLLERANKAEVMAQLCSLECVLSLKEAFFHQLFNSFRQTDFQLRNDLLVITSLIAETSSSLLIESLFAKQLIALITFPEMKIQNPLVQKLKLTYNNEDFKMKKLLLNLLVLMSRDLAVVQLYKEERVLAALLVLAKPPAASDQQQPQPRPGPGRHWSPTQQEELQLHALAVLASVAPLMLDQYAACQGNTCLLLLLDWCIGKDAYISHGHSFHSSGGRGNKKAQMRHCVRALRSMTSLGDDSVNQDLCEQGTINQLLGILMQMEASPEEEDAVIVEMKSDIQLILSAMCESDMHRKELFGSEGVEMAVHFLRKGSEKFYSGLGHNKLVLSTVDCVWSCIVGCYTTEDYFLAKQGAFLLLDLLNSSPRCVHGVVLGTLLELCDNPNTISHILAWSASGGRTAPGLLLELWRAEEAQLGVSRNQHGGIADPRRPILSRHQQESEPLSFPARVPSLAVMEISENLRSKIYSIFCKLGFQELPGLALEDYVTLSIVRRYLDFKVGEVWEEISREISVDGVRPVTPDREAMCAISEAAEDTARRTAAEQSAILEQLRQAQLHEEDTIYKEMKSHWKQQELTLKSWDQYVSKTSNYDILKEVKAQREKYIESTRAKKKCEDGILRPTEHFIGRVISMETTDAQGPAGVRVSLARAPIKVPEELSTRDTDYFNAVSVKD